MNTLASIAASGATPAPLRLARQGIALLGRIPDSAIALLGRFAIAGIFWKSGQTKIEGLAIDIVSGEFTIGLPRLSDSVVGLFRDEYKLPLIPPELAAPMAAFAEHLFPLLILIGLATRFSALALLVHDGDDTVPGLSRRLANTRRLGGRVVVHCRARTGRHLA
jgi:putative oxidoreductase